MIHIKQELVALKMLKLNASIVTGFDFSGGCTHNDLVDSIKYGIEKMSMDVPKIVHDELEFYPKVDLAEMKTMFSSDNCSDDNLKGNKYISRIKEIVEQCPKYDKVKELYHNTNTLTKISVSDFNEEIYNLYNDAIKKLLDLLTYDNLDLGLSCYMLNAMGLVRYLVELENERLEDEEEGSGESQVVVEGFESIYKQLNHYEGVVLSFSYSDIVSGMEASSVIETIKNAGMAVYETVIKVLKAIKDFIFGEDDDDIKATISDCRKVLDELKKVDPNTPIKGGKATNPNTFYKKTFDSPKIVKAIGEDTAIRAGLDKMKALAEKAGDNKTAGELSTFLDSIGKETTSTINIVTDVLKRRIADSEKQANSLRNPKLPKEGEPAEVSVGIKAENKENSDKAKAMTKDCQALTGLRNSLKAVLVAIKSSGEGIKETKVDSAFKG